MGLTEKIKNKKQVMLNEFGKGLISHEKERKWFICMFQTLLRNRRQKTTQTLEMSEKWTTFSGKVGEDFFGTPVGNLDTVH